MDERRGIFRVYIECKHGSQPINDQNSQMLYYNSLYRVYKTEQIRNRSQLLQSGLDWVG